MSWTLETQTDGEIEWAQYVDVEAAEAWRAAASSWLAANVPDRWEDQRRALVSLATCLGALSSSLDLPVQSFEPWARTLLQRDPGPDPLPIGYPASPWRVDALARIRRHSEDARNWAEGQFITDLAHRIGLTREGAVVVIRLDAAHAPDTPRGADYRRQDGGEHRGSFWGAMAWSEWYPPTGAAERVAWSVSVVPGLWHWTHFQDAARLCEASTWRDLVSRSRAWVRAKNLLTARAIGGAVPADIIQATADALALPGAGPPMRVRAIYGAVAGAVSLAVPIGPAIALVVSGIIEGLYLLGGAAVAYQVDLWGRREPVLEVERLTGVITTRERRAPTHTPPRNWSEHTCPEAWRTTAPRGEPVGDGATGRHPTRTRGARVTPRGRELREGEAPPPAEEQPPSDGSGGGGGGGGGEALSWGLIAAAVARALGLW